MVNRVSGFLDYWAKYAPTKWEITKDIALNGGDVEKAESDAAKLLKKNENIKGIYGCNNTSTVGIAKTLTKQKRTDIVMVGFDMAEETKQFIKDPDYRGVSLMQKQDQMGYLGIGTLNSLINGKKSEQKYFDTGIIMIDSDYLMKNRRKNMKKRGVPLALYLTVCLAIIVSAYFHLSRIAQNFNTQHLELITGLYAEKMNESMEYLQNYVKEDVKMIQAMENKEPEKIQKRLEKNLNQKMFCNVGFILKNGEVYGSKCAVADIKKKNFDKQALSSAISFNSDPYQSSETGNMIMTVFVPVAYDSQIRILYVSIMIEQLRKLGVYELLQGKISVHLLKVDSENFITCISSNEDTTANGWNNLLLQQKYFKYDENYSYKQWIKDMRSAKKEGRFAAQIKGEDSTISYRSISGRIRRTGP